MATSRDAVVSESSCLNHGSDFIEEYLCDPCLKDGKEVKGINHCPKCSEYFCEECTKQHGKFRLTAEHNWMLKSVNPSNSPTSSGNKRQSVDSPSYDAQSVDSPSYDAQSVDTPSYDAQSVDTPSYNAQSDNTSGCAVHVSDSRSADESTNSPDETEESGHSPARFQDCDESHGDITTYCANHDVVVCDRCLSADHKLCQDLSRIEPESVDSEKRDNINIDQLDVRQKPSDYVNLRDVQHELSQSANTHNQQSEIKSVKQEVVVLSMKDQRHAVGKSSVDNTNGERIFRENATVINTNQDEEGKEYARLCQDLSRIEPESSDSEKRDNINIDQLDVRQKPSDYVNLRDVQHELSQSANTHNQQSEIKSVTQVVVLSMKDQRHAVGKSSVDNTNGERLFQENATVINTNQDEEGKECAGQSQHELKSVDKLEVLDGNLRSGFLAVEKDDHDCIRDDVVGEDAVRIAYKAILYDEFDIGIPGEQNVCYITGTCEISNGAILIADYNNGSVKKLDEAFNVTGYLAMSSCPYGLCQTKHSEVAVTLTLTRTVVFLSTAGFLKATRSFKVDDGCKGICFSEGMLFISCGGDPGNESYGPEGPGFVGAYDMEGTPLRLIRFDNAGLQLFSMPCHLATIFGGSRLHIADQEGGVITVNRQGRLLSAFSYEHLLWARGICTLPGENTLVCGHGSNNVIQLDATGKMIAELLKEEDGIAKPFSLLFLQDSSRLVVTQWKSSMIQVYDLRIPA